MLLSLKELLEVPNGILRQQRAQWPSHLPKAFGGTLLLPFCWVSQELRGCIWLLCFLGPGRESLPERSALKEADLGLGVLLQETALSPTTPSSAGTQFASQRPLSSGVLQSALHPPLPPSLASAEAPRLSQPCQACHPPRSLPPTPQRGRKRGRRNTAPPPWVPPKVTRIWVLTGAVG